MLLQIVGDRVAMSEAGTAWHWLQGSYRHRCVCGQWVHGAWVEARSLETRCPQCVQIRPFVAEGSIGQVGTR